MSADSLQRNGFVVVPGVLTDLQCESWRQEIKALLTEPSGAAIQGRSSLIVGGRNLQQRWDRWRELQHHPALAQLLNDQLGAAFGLVRILFFDKPPGQSWNLALHRDKTIAVDEHYEPADPYSKPTTKAGVKHVEANEELLKSMVTLRVHLDAMHRDNGPLIIVPGSHHDGTSPGDEVGRDLYCQRGDVLAMKPLLLHGSRACAPDCQDHRRVVHLEFAPANVIKDPYRWHCYDACG